MKIHIMILGLLMSTSVAFAQTQATSQDVDGTPSAQVALKQAQDYVYDTGFSNILDESSIVSVQQSGEDPGQYLFKATAKNPGVPDCSIEVKVSKETGMAFQDQILPCQNLQATGSN